MIKCKVISQNAINEFEEAIEKFVNSGIEIISLNYGTTSYLEKAPGNSDYMHTIHKHRVLILYKNEE